MKYYHPISEFQGAIRAASAPSNNNDLVRKQDAAGLSYISSIAAGSSDLLSVNASGALSVDSLLISSVTVNAAAASLAAYFSANQTEANGLKEGDVLVLTGATGGTETYMTKTQPGSGNQIAGNLVAIETGLTSAEIVAKLSDGEGINISGAGAISVDMLAGAGISKTVSAGQITLAVDANSDEITEGSTNLYHTTGRARSSISVSGDLAYNSGTGVLSSTKYTDANARSAFSAGGDLAYNSGTGQFSVSKFTQANARASISVSGDLAYNSGTGVLSATKYTDTNARSAFSAGGDLAYNSGTGQFSVSKFTQANARSSISVSGDLAYNSGTGVLSVTTFKASDFNSSFNAKSTADLSENSSNQYFTNARAQAAISGGGDITKVGGTLSVTTYKSSNFNTDFNGKSTADLSENSSNQYFTNARAQAAITGGNGILKTGGSLAIDLAGGNDGLKIDAGKLKIDIDDHRSVTTLNLVANTWTTITHNLGQAVVHVSCYSGVGNLIAVDVKKGTGAQGSNTVQIKSISALSSVEVLCSI